MFIRSLLAIILFAAPAYPQEATLLGSYRWEDANALHGGFSALEFDASGQKFITVSDRGSVGVGRVQRDENGVVSSVTLEGLAPLKGVNSDELSRYDTDSEGLAVAEDGTLYVSFEGNHRIWSYATPNARAVPIDGHVDFASLQTNSGLEALAVDSKGRLLTLPERSGDKLRPFPVYRYNGNTWSQPFALRRDGEYLPVALDVGPDGRLYLLERWFRGIGFSSRVRRFDLGEEGLSGEVTLIETGLGTHDNLEGMAVWRDEAGIRITLISDDNFKPFQITEFVDYRVAD
ncbi:esterase-like activity of phytase family protein [Celeribacter sp.]|uniref:esterase-like activity of phytase family protein n=1 Tax=Celeribacter sp. TaxID=1890673 RepID=UPI003A8E2DBC